MHRRLVALPCQKGLQRSSVLLSADGLLCSEGGRCQAALYLSSLAPSLTELHEPVGSRQPQRKWPDFYGNTLVLWYASRLGSATCPSETAE